MRNKKIDQIKGAAILGVIFIHVSAIYGDRSFLHDVAYSISRISVPYFITLFCYFMEKSLIKDENHISIYVSRFNKLIIPFLSWGLLYFVLTADFSNLIQNPTKIITMHWSGYGWSGQYFFILLFQLIVFFPLIRSLAGSDFARWSSLIITGLFCIYNTYAPELVPHVLAKISDRLIVYWVPYALLGVVMAHDKHNHINSGFMRNISVFVVLLIPCEYIFSYRLTHPISEYLRISILLASYITLPILLSKSENINGRFGSMLSCFGSHSMTLFVSNPLIILLIGEQIQPFFSENLFLTCFMSILATIFIASSGVVLSVMIRKSFLHRIV